MSIDPVTNHRKRETGVLVYPAYSRRSGGLSMGINLFPDRKVCSFDCPYCEVFPFGTGSAFSLAGMESALAEALAGAKEQGLEVQDICFSGNGEPTLSPHFPAALEAAFRIRDREAPLAKLVLITNGAGLLDGERFELLRRAARGDLSCGDLAEQKDQGLRIWLKLDAGTESWYRAINRSSIPFGPLTEKIRAFVKCSPLTLQTMICAINGEAPPAAEARAWEALLADLAASAALLREVQIYGKVRPAPEDPLATALTVAFLEARAASLRNVLVSLGKEIPVAVYP